MRFLTNILAKAGLIVDGTTQLNTIANAAIDTDKFLVSDGGVIKYRTGAELASDLGSLTASTLKHQVKLGEAIAKGQAVYVSSADGTNMIVSKASNATEATSSKTLGLIETGGILNDQVNVITEGLLAGLDTSTATAGDPVWLGTNGNLIFGLINKPSAPAHLVFIGIVTRAQSNNGEIFVKVQNGFELQELHNVAIASIANKDLLMYESATSLWKNKALGTVIGGVSTQYVKGDGTLGSFPDIGGGGGMVYYLNGSISSGVAGYSQMSRTPVLGAGTDFSKTGDGLICQFLTDANDPSLLSVPSGAWRFGLYASMGTAGNSSKFYVEIYKYDGTTFTLIGTSSGTPESVTNGTATEYYTTTVAMATTALTVTDRIAVKIYATDNNTRTMTIHTENSNLCDIATTFPTGISAINGLITPSQYLSTTTTGTDFTISSSSNTHYFNLPVASATVTGKLSSTDWSTFNSKQNALGYTPVNQTRTLTINGVSYDLTADRTWSVGTVTSVGVSVPTGLTVSNSPVISSGTIAIAFTAGYSIPTTASQSNWDTAYNNRITSLTTTGTSGAATLVSNTLNIPQYQAQGSYITSLTGEATASGPGSASVTLTNSAVIGKILTGLNVTGGTVLATDSILTAFGKLQNQVNGIAGGVTYQGVWDASANSPSLTSSVGTKGYYYVVSVAGSTNLNGITDWKLGDWVIFNGNTWEKVDNTDAVVSVNGFTGAVSLTTTNIAEGTNLYYTDTRARAAISLTTTGSSGAATYSGGVLNVPQYTLAGLGGVPSNRTLTINGTAYDLSADRTWTISVPVSSVSGSGAGISVSPTTGAVVISNTGVTSLNGSTGAITGIATTAQLANYLPLAGGTMTGTINSSVLDYAFVSQSDGTSSLWRGRILSKNASANVASFLGTYASIAGVFAHNNALTAWADLYVNTVDGSSGGTVRMPSSVLINGNQAIHAGNYNSYAPTLTGGGASGTWSINITGNAGYASSAGNADTVDGYHASTSTIGNYIVVRDGNGYIFGNYINMTDDGNPGGGTSISSFITKQGDNYYRSVSPTNAMASIRGVASGTWGINISGNAATAGSSGLLSSLGSYVWSASTQGRDFAQGMQVSFVSANEGYPEYGSVVRIHTYPNDGASAEIYVPYSSIYGGTSMRYRLGQYNNAGWTSWKTIIDDTNYNSYSPTLTGGGASGTWGINVTGTAGSETLATVTGRGASTSTDLTFTGFLTMGTGGTSYIRMGRFPASVTNTGEAWIGRASDRNSGTMTVQLGGNSASSRQFEVVDYAWSTVLFNVSSGGDATASSSLRAPIFYDSNNTAYYANFADSGTSVNIAGKITTAISGGTIISHGAMTDAFGYNSSYGTYIGSPVGGTYYIYANGTFYDNGTIRTFIHSGNIGSQSVNYASSAGSASTSSQVTINYNNDSNSTYQMLWGSGNSVYGTAGVYLNPSSDYVYANSFNAGDWFRSSGNSGWYNSTYGGGIYQTEATMVRTYDNRGFWIDGGTTNTVQDATLYVTATNNNDWGLVVNKYNGSATEYGLEVRVGNGATYGLSVTGSGSRNFYVTGSGAVYGSIFYDIGNTAYFCDPASTSNLSAITTGGAGTYNLFQTWTGLNGYHGFYSSLNGAHFYVNNGTYGSWRIAGSRNGWNGIEFDASNGQVVLMINNDSNTSGFHNNSSGWHFRWNNGTAYVYKDAYGGGTAAVVLDSSNSPYAYNMNQYVRTTDNPTFNILTLSSYLTVGNGLNSSDIYMHDGDEGTRRIHCNSNRIGFLNQSASWGAYCDDTGNWVSDFSITAASDLRGNDVYTTGGWFRNHTNNNGIYWSNTGWHLYPSNSSDFYMRSGANSASIRFLRSDGTTMSFLHTDSGYTMGFLTDSGSWRFNVNNSGAMQAFGPIRRSAHLAGWLEGTYNNIGPNDAKSNPIYTIGSSYNPAEGSLSNMYGIGYSHPNFWGSGKVGGWGLYVASAGVIDAIIGGDGTATSIWARTDIVAYSDARVKENVEVVQNALEKIQAIRGVTFTRNDVKDTKKRSAGVIAQEVLKIFPEVVTGSEEDMYSVAYGNMAALFIEAIKEQQKQIEELKLLISGTSK